MVKTPIDLQLNGNIIATISSYFYETPWASGDVLFKDLSLFRTLVNLTRFENFDFELDYQNLSEAEEEKAWTSKLEEFSLSEADLELNHAAWSIITGGGDEMKIYSPKFYDEGYLDWRF